MSEQVNQVNESQKTVVAFIAGLLIGGLLVWVFASPSEESQLTDEVANEASVIDTETDTSADKTDEVSSNTTVDPANTVASQSEPAEEMATGEGNIVVKNQSAGTIVTLDSVIFPSDEGWIGVRDYQNGQLTGLLGVARFSKEQGLIPNEVELLRSTEAGSQYAVVFYTESGDREFSLADDVQVEGVLSTFTAR